MVFLWFFNGFICFLMVLYGFLLFFLMVLFNGFICFLMVVYGFLMVFLIVF